jgi:hypothetical protein
VDLARPEPYLGNVGYTKIDPSKIFEKRFAPVAALAQDGLADTSSLFEMISRYIDEDMLVEVSMSLFYGKNNVKDKPWNVCTPRRCP